MNWADCACAALQDNNKAKLALAINWITGGFRLMWVLDESFGHLRALKIVFCQCTPIWPSPEQLQGPRPEFWFRPGRNIDRSRQRFPPHFHGLLGQGVVQADPNRPTHLQPSRKLTFDLCDVVRTCLSAQFVSVERQNRCRCVCAIPANRQGGSAARNHALTVAHAHLKT